MKCTFLLDLCLNFKVVQNPLVQLAYFQFFIMKKRPHHTKLKKKRRLEGCGETKVFPVSLPVSVAFLRLGAGDTREEGSADSSQFRPSGVNTHKTSS